MTNPSKINIGFERPSRLYSILEMYDEPKGNSYGDFIGYVTVDDEYEIRINTESEEEYKMQMYEKAKERSPNDSYEP